MAEKKAEPKIYVASDLEDVASCLKNLAPDLDIEDIPISETTGVTEANLQKLRESAEILLCDADVLSKIFYTSKKLKWAQTISAGVNALINAIDHNKPIPPIEVTRTGEGFGVKMAEYVLGQIISTERKFISIHEEQKLKQFNQSRYNGFRPLSSLRIGIIGAGQIGMEIAGICKMMGMEVWILTRQRKEKTSSFDMQKTFNQLPEFLKNCDYVCCVLPSTSDTQDMLSGDILENCSEKKSIFINIGRGNVIDEQTIEKAIRLNWIGGAILDVFETEPLPPDSTLWNLPNVVISPHVAGPSFPGQVAAAFLENYKKFIAKEPLSYKVDFNKGY